MFRTPALVRMIFTLCAFVLAAPGHALTTYCAGTAQQLYDALGNAKASADDVVVIKLRSGTYDAAQVSGPFELYVGHSNQLVELSGGWSGSNGACTTKSFNPAATVLLGTSQRSSLNTGAVGFALSGGQAYAHDLTLRNSAFVGDLSACLNGLADPGNTLLLERLRLEQCNSTGSFGGALLNADGGIITLRNFAMRDSQSPWGGGLLAETAAGGIVRLTQLSFANVQAGDPSASASSLFLQGYGGGRIDLGNSVVWGGDPSPGTADMYVVGDVHLTRVHTGSIKGVPASNIAPTTGNPGFIASNDPHLRPDSILIDTGDDAPAGGIGTFDVEGKARVQGSFVDVGAYEAKPVTDTIFRNSFEP